MRTEKKFDPANDEYLSYLLDISREDVEGLQKAQQSYGNSWKLRGGVGAFMMLARKWDRIEKRVGTRPVDTSKAVTVLSGGSLPTTPSVKFGDRFDIFQHLAADDRAEGLIDDIRDLRRYLLLVEAEARAHGTASANTQHRDNG